MFISCHIKCFAAKTSSYGNLNLNNCTALDFVLLNQQLQNYTLLIKTKHSGKNIVFQTLLNFWVFKTVPKVCSFLSVDSMF